MPTTAREGWLRLPNNDRRQHFFRDGISVCGRYITAVDRFGSADRPDQVTCPACRTGAPVQKR